MVPVQVPMLAMPVVIMMPVAVTSSPGDWLSPSGKPSCRSFSLAVGLFDLWMFHVSNDSILTKSNVEEVQETACVQSPETGHVDGSRIKLNFKGQQIQCNSGLRMWQRTCGGLRNAQGWNRRLLLVLGGSLYPGCGSSHPRL